ncbi:Cystathionine beta-synthase family protein [Perilla frutescens var. frutescens]|nr:Cystathionine beta-synthase family protein [Perilla frutescens var. frutescens]
MASVFLYHVVGDLTVGKPELSEFPETETVAAAIGAIGDSAEGGIPVWRKRSLKSPIESAESRQQRFVGILNALDIAAFLARDDCLSDQEKAINTPVSEVVLPDNSALKVVDPGTRLIDALEMMKQGTKRLLVPKSLVWRGMSKRFSILFNGKWLKNADPSGSASASASPSAGSSTNTLLTLPNALRPPPSSSTSSIQDKFCCLSREDVLRFLIGCLGALAPLPLSSIASLGAVNPNYCWIDASCPATEAAKKLPHDPCAVAVVEPTPEGQQKIIGEISSAKMWKCDYLSTAWALAKLSAGQFVTGVEDHTNLRSSLPDDINNTNDVAGDETSNGGSRLRNPNLSSGRSMYRGRSSPLTCKVTSSLAAVMAQMLSHRATHVWVTEHDNEDVLVGVVGYTDILAAVSRQPAPAPAPATATAPALAAPTIFDTNAA